MTKCFSYRGNATLLLQIWVQDLLRRTEHVIKLSLELAPGIMWSTNVWMEAGPLLPREPEEAGSEACSGSENVYVLP